MVSHGAWKYLTYILDAFTTSLDIVKRLTSDGYFCFVLKVTFYNIKMFMNRSHALPLMIWPASGLTAVPNKLLK